MNSLARKSCIPCRGGIPPMKQDEIEEKLPHVPEWQLEGGKLTRSFEFKNFKEALSFVNRVGGISEEEEHHPDIELFSWNKVKLTLYTHKIGGLHENDFIIASKIDTLLLANTGIG